MKTDYYFKFKNMVPDDFYKKKDINILEFGVGEGNTTSLFLELCERLNGSLISVDIKDCTKLFEKKNWNFIHSEDLNITKIKNYIENKLFDLICLDTIHTKNHIQKMIDIYYKFLKVGGIFLIDGVSHIPYLKNNYRDNFYSEINNQEIFNYLLGLLNNEQNEIQLDFSFQGSGVARIIKNKDVLLKEKKIISRKKTLKNYIRKLIS